jgi:hypothetical protein
MAYAKGIGSMKGVKFSTAPHSEWDAIDAMIGKRVCIRLLPDDSDELYTLEGILLRYEAFGDATLRLDDGTTIRRGPTNGIVLA